MIPLQITPENKENSERQNETVSSDRIRQAVSLSEVTNVMETETTSGEVVRKKSILAKRPYPFDKDGDSSICNELELIENKKSSADILEECDISEECDIPEEYDISEECIEKADKGSSSAVHVDEFPLNFKIREERFDVGNYLEKNRVAWNRRAKIVDWLVEMHNCLDMSEDSLYTAIKLTDLYLDRTADQIENQNMELVGICALFIAGKLLEQRAPPVDDFVSICGTGFTCNQILKMERQVLEAVNYRLTYPLACQFLQEISKAVLLDSTTLTLARYYLETSLLFYEFVGVRGSLMASACLLLALRSRGHYDWNIELVKITGYELENVESLMWTINHALIMRSKLFPTLGVTFQKYSTIESLRVAELPFLDDIFCPAALIGPPPELSFKK
ncbi:unnamed protein product [Enterobius vermicularis]|uniref:G2/mitotic-specific cyclin-B3 n=1 Tax=Enterobius vermicularis TaxID=51028 RepID=A0A0N4VIS4_ENTVE|nr:unnamed protein product [Enterobius vermicularis]